MASGCAGTGPRERSRSRSPGRFGAAGTAASKGVAIVTGASRGIGASIARALGKEGYAVAVGFLAGKEGADVVVAGITAKGGEARAFQADVGVEAQVVKLFSEVSVAWPGRPLTVLVNNAGVLGPKPCKLEDVSTESLRSVFDTNVLGPLICCREFAKLGAEGGRIVNISSGAAYIPSGLYGMSKGALNSMQIWLVKELAHKGIRMNAVSPGVTRTDMTEDMLEGFDFSQVPLGRVGEPHEIADAVVYLTSEKSSYVSGANLRVAGGRPPGTTLG